MPNGASALFSGPPGTGKTIAAEAVAAKLGVEIRRVSPSSFVSPYVGQTEINLRKLFAEAQQEKYLLFIDEAESIFINRQSTGNAHHMLSTSSELLQRVEEFRGVLIIATNLKEMLDPAFGRRFLFHIHFPMPNEETRRRLWGKWRSQLSITKNDIAALARQFSLSGGEIRNVAVRAIANDRLSGKFIEEMCASAMKDRTGVFSKPIGIGAS